MKKEDFVFNLRDITEIGILCGLAIVLDTFVKIPIAISGGSINIAMFPLIFIALHKGWFKGFIAGAIIFGIITCLIDGYGFATYPFDYFIAFGSVAIVGFFRNLIISEKLTAKNYIFFAISILLCMTVRFFSHTISGIIIYELDFVGSMVYQLPYILPTAAVLLVILVPLLSVFKSLFARLS